MLKIVGRNKLAFKAKSKCFLTDKCAIFCLNFCESEAQKMDFLEFWPQDHFDKESKPLKVKY